MTVKATRTPQTGDVVLSVDGAPVTSTVDWQRRAGAVSAGQTATVRVRRGDAEVEVPFAGARSSPPGAGQQGAAIRATSARPLSHEAGHLFLLAHARAVLPDAPATPQAEYGSAALPDWIDEAFATLCEMPPLVRSRFAPGPCAHTVLHTHLWTSRPQGHTLAQWHAARIVAGAREVRALPHAPSCACVPRHASTHSSARAHTHTPFGGVACVGPSIGDDKFSPNRFSYASNIVVVHRNRES